MKVIHPSKNVLKMALKDVGMGQPFYHCDELCLRLNGFGAIPSPWPKGQLPVVRLYSGMFEWLDFSTQVQHVEAAVVVGSTAVQAALDREAAR
jgi:hypothetical protein